MNKNFDKRIVRRKKIFENIKVGKKDSGIKRKFNSSNYTVKKNYKLMKGVSYGNDINYQRYMAYLDKIREGEELDISENLNEKNNKDFSSDLDINKLLSKKISFSEFVNKYKINPYIMQYFDYFDIQKINRKEIERNLKSANNKKPIKIPSEYNEDSSELIEDEKNKNSKIMSVNKTENNLDEKYNNIYKNYSKQKSYHKSKKNLRRINLS